MPWDIWVIFLLLGLILPWRGQQRMKKLLAMPRVTTVERLTLYASTMALQWCAVALVAWRGWAHRFTASQLGLTIHDRTRILVVSIAGALTMAAFQWLNLRRGGGISLEARGPGQAPAESNPPQTTGGLVPHFALALSPGIREGVLYRGVVIER